MLSMETEEPIAIVDWQAYSTKSIICSGRGLSLNTFTTYSLTYRNLIDDDPHIYNWLGQRVRNYLGEEQLNPQGGEASIATRAENTEENIANRTYLAYQFYKESER